MQRQIFPNTQTNLNQSLPLLHNIFSQKQIVQSYSQRNNQHLIFGGHQKQVNHNLRSNDIFLQHPQIDNYNKKPKRFAEDDFFEQLHSANIVENFCMVDQKDEHYEQFENVFKGRGQKPLYLNQDMLASSSQNNDVPSRNSSLSSLSEKNQMVNVNRSFVHDDLIEKVTRKNHVKGSHLPSRKNYQNHYRGNSQNQMDIQNSPFRDQSQNHTTQFPKNNNRNQSVLNQPPISQFNSRIEFTRNNVNVSPQKSSNFPTFRRMDIDEARQKQQRLFKIQKIQQIGCNCKKSKCLKMYCECFNLQIFCNENCNCTGCCNQQSNDQHKKAVLDALTRNPKAFNQVTQKIDSAFKLGVELTEVKKGCKCKKTKCQKKYCECYNSGQICGKFCKCQGCQNC